MPNKRKVRREKAEIVDNKYMKEDSIIAREQST